MGSGETLKKRKASKKNTSVVHVPFSSPYLKDVDNVIAILLDCIKLGDPETFCEVLVAHLITVNKVEFAKKSGLGRRTIYDLLDPEKEFNPEFKTLAALFEALAA